VPTLPVFAGEIQAPGLGMAIAFFDDDGQPLVHAKGELVCTRSFPSMPIGFLNDPDGAKYRSAYFERFPGVWHHGDYGEFTQNGGVVIQGRSDAVLNRGGVRIGTAEIYREVERLPGVLECIAVAQRWQTDVRIVLFVKLKPGIAFDAALEAEIRQRIREGASPRHVPDLVIPVADIPRTRSGKLVEIAVRNVIEGEPVKNVGALANPEALELYRDIVPK
jgi:acetoacetyl-CoA synthetase